MSRYGSGGTRGGPSSFAPTPGSVHTSYTGTALGGTPTRRTGCPPVRRGARGYDG
ncbi:hypothetical protein SVEN_1128 [Streptomyces venezuelae ATCC 10712]|uniref:Uncharacterized protein n=1 Tax=Streptomyces venezuelae (strain ATCC 10712 / CBS 650.69 / DSM 40230 / JCM 4526 / NBRC 13096 / PD 04745) TaxID=953739 RepID=F2RCQ7_STRVP|nr:hypothetical protein SVEN_1128 [Streptomyces venezuelae ATCC 10712]